MSWYSQLGEIKENGDIVYFQLHYNILHIIIGFVIFWTLCLLICFFCRHQRQSKSKSQSNETKTETQELETLVDCVKQECHQAEEAIMKTNQDQERVDMISVEDYKQSVSRYLANKAGNIT